MATYFLIALSLKTIEINLKPVFKFLIACLALEAVEGRRYDKETSCSPSWTFKKIHDVTTRIKFVFFKEHVGKMCNVKNCWICMYVPLTLIEKFLEHFMGI